MGAGPNGWRPACACETLVPRALLGPPSWLRAADRAGRLLGSVPGRDPLPQHGRVPACAGPYTGRSSPVVNDPMPGSRPWCESAAASGGAGAALFHRSRPCQAEVKEGLTTSARRSHPHRTVRAGGWPHPARSSSVVDDPVPGSRPWCESAAASGGAGAVLFHRSRPCQAKVKEGLTTSARRSHPHRTVRAGGWPHPARSSSVVNDPVPGSRPWWESAAASGGAGAVLFYHPPWCLATEGLTAGARGFRCHRAPRFLVSDQWRHEARLGFLRRRSDPPIVSRGCGRARPRHEANACVCARGA
jgi:hypothetical protein